MAELIWGTAVNSFEESERECHKMENKFTEIMQIGLIARDRESVINSMREVFGEDPSQIMKTLKDENNRYYGNLGDFEAELIFYRFANIELEFIIPMSGKSIWQDFLEEHGEGLHHLLFNVDSFDGAKTQMAANNIGIAQQGVSVFKVPGLKWAYFDLKDKLPFIAEIRNAKEVM